MRNITICIKTFERIDAAKRLVQSIYTIYNDKYKILIADDGVTNNIAEFSSYNNIDYYHLDYDVGLSKGRNYLLDKIQTKYFVICDDDFIFTSKTDIRRMKKLLEEYDLDILGAKYFNTDFTTSIAKNFKFDKDVLYVRSLTENKEDMIMCDMVPNFFIAKTDKVKELLWDEDLKIMEHVDFFIRAKSNNFKIGYCDDIYIVHDRVKNKTYRNMRFKRAKHFKQLACKKHNLSNYIFV